MPERISFEEETSLIRIRAWGKGTIDEWDNSRKEVLKLHNQYGTEKLLVDIREQQLAPSASELFDFGSNWPRTIKCALLVGDKTEGDQNFLSTVALNRGLPMRVFKTEKAALDWLE